MSFASRLVDTLTRIDSVAVFRLSRGRVTACADVTPGAVVRIHGRVSATERGLVTTPTGQQALAGWATVRCYNAKGGMVNARWMESRGFRIADESGALIVDPSQAVPYLVAERSTFESSLEVVPDGVVALAKRTDPTADLDHLLGYQEQAVKQGEVLDVFGSVEARSGADLDYRGTKEQVLVLTKGRVPLLLWDGLGSTSVEA